MSHKIALKVIIVISTLSSQHHALKVLISLLRIRASLTIVYLVRADTLALMKVLAVSLLKERFMLAHLDTSAKRVLILTLFHALQALSEITGLQQKMESALHSQMLSINQAPALQLPYKTVNCAQKVSTVQKALVIVLPTLVSQDTSVQQDQDK